MKSFREQARASSHGKLKSMVGHHAAGAPKKEPGSQAQQPMDAFAGGPQRKPYADGGVIGGMESERRLDQSPRGAKGKTNINIVIAPQSTAPREPPPMMPPMPGPPVPAPPGVGGPGAPGLPPGLPAGLGAGLPGGLGGPPPGPMGMAANGGRIGYKRGGKVKKADGGSISDAMPPRDYRLGKGNVAESKRTNSPGRPLSQKEAERYNPRSEEEISRFRQGFDTKGNTFIPSQSTQETVSEELKRELQGKKAGGAVKHSDEAEDKKLIKKMMAAHEKTEGEKPKKADGGAVMAAKERLAKGLKQRAADDADESQPLRTRDSVELGRRAFSSGDYRPSEKGGMDYAPFEPKRGERKNGGKLGKYPIKDGAGGGLGRLEKARAAK